MITTSIATILLSLLMLSLSWRVINTRYSEKISLGDNGNKKLERRMRAFGNFVEYTPLALIITALIEYQQGWAWLPAAFLVIGRYLHAYAFLENHDAKPHFRFRRAGMLLTLISLSLGAIMLALMVIRKLVL